VTQQSANPGPSRVRGATTGAIGGFASGLTGIGGGTVMVPLLTGFLRVPQHRAHATSLVIVIFAAGAALVLYVSRGDVDWAMAAAVAIGGSVGGQIGARAMHRVPELKLRAIFALFLLAVGVRLLVFG
jgi:uncharacterized membrane protein YfcA